MCPMTTERTTGRVPDHADVVVVGGGVMGVSAAFHLAEAGLTDVVLVERNDLGSGSTGKAAGGVRVQFSDELNIRIAQRSIEAFERFDERPGGDIGLHQVGYLFLLRDQSDVDVFERSVELQTSIGLPTRMVTAAQAAELCPVAYVGDVLAASFCPLDGYATPDAVVGGYARAARRLGATLVQRCDVLDIDVRHGTIEGVVTSEGRIATSTVLCAAGAWSREVGAMVDIVLPVDPFRRQIAYTEPIDWLPTTMPMTIDFATGFYFHREGLGLLMGMADDGDESTFDESFDPSWVERLAETALTRIPQLDSVGFAGGWGGLYEVTPDHNAIIGEAPDVSRFLYATGFSGHGFLQGPAVGEIVRDLVLRREPFVDVSALDVSRFAGRDSRPEYNIV
jgi:sarcosine oxidase, subunit beta